MKKKILFLIGKLIPKELYLRYLHYKHHRIIPSLRNPKTLSEKIQYLKLNFQTELHQICTDKLTAKEYVGSIIENDIIIPTLRIFNSLEELHLDSLQKPFVIKTNHGSGGNFFVGKEDEICLKTIKQFLSNQMKINHYDLTKEFQYKNIKPKILIEPMLIDSNGNIPNDIKLHCFHGKVEFIQVDIDRFTNHKRNFYSKTWELLDFSWSPTDSNQNLLWTRNSDINIEKPKRLDELIQYSEKLSSPFKYVRIDFYDKDDKIFFGEITFHHGSGTEIFDPLVYDAYFGGKIKL